LCGPSPCKTYIVLISLLLAKVRVCRLGRVINSYIIHRVYNYEEDIDMREENKSMTGIVLLAAAAIVTGGARSSVAGSSPFAALESTSKAFAELVRRTAPAVVFIRVEKDIQAVSPYEAPMQYNDPFDLFNDEFFNRFFRGRIPRRPRNQKFVQMGQGSGFIISRDGYIMTNNHVAGDADRIFVKLSDGREFKAKRVGTDPKSDVAVIKIDAGNLPIIPLGDSDAIEVGEWVIAIGNPFGLAQTVTVGVVSAKGRSSVGIEEYEDFIQTDAAINPGNSGGPLINLRGEAIGINTAIFSKSGGYMGIGFAIPVNMAKAIKDQLIKTGSVTRGYLGVIIQDLTAGLAKSFGLGESQGVVVAEVVKGSPADKGGLRPGDAITEFQGRKVTNAGEFRNRVALTPPGTKVELAVLRNGRRCSIRVTVGALGQEARTAAAQSDLLKKIGIAVHDLTPDIAKQLGYEHGQGVVVTAVEPGSVAALAGLQAGTLILEVNRRPVHNTREFAQALAVSAKTKSVLMLVRQGQYQRFIGFEIE